MSELSTEEMTDLKSLEAKKPKVPSYVIKPQELSDDTAFDPDNIDDEMMRQAGLYAHYAVKASQAAEAADNAKIKRDITESKIDMEIRDNAAEEGTKLTEGKITAMVKTDVRWVKASKYYNAAKATAELGKYALEAFKQKRDMLVQIGVSMREEMKGEVRVKTAQAVEEARGDARERAREIAASK